MPSQVRDTLGSLLVLGFAEQLEVWDIVTWQPTGLYDPAALRPAYLGPDEPVNAPAERVLLTVRDPLPIDGTRHTVDVPIGINWRGPEPDAGGVSDPLGGHNFLGLLKRRLHRHGPITLGEIPVSAIRFSTGGSIGADARGRYGATATYLFRCREASANG